MRPLLAAALCTMLAFAMPAWCQSSAKDAFAEVFGVKLHYTDTGTGSVVLLLHGLADDVHVWDRVAGPLSQHYRVVALDFPGFGQSGKPTIDYRVATLVDFVDGFLDALHIEHAAMVGNSLGGWVAAAFALARPRRVSALVLVDAAGYADLARTLGPAGMRALRLASRDDLRYLAPLTFHDPRYSSDAAIDAGFAERMTAGDGYAVSRIVEAMGRRDDVLDGRLAGIRAATLIVWGEEDRLIPAAFARRFAHDIRGARLLMLPRCGHMPQVECPEPFDAALERFLERSLSSAGSR